MRTPHRLVSGFFVRQRGIEGGAVFQHGAGDVEQAASDGAQSAAMAMTAAAQGGVFGGCRGRFRISVRCPGAMHQAFCWLEK